MVITHETHVFAGSNPHSGFGLATQVDFLFLIPPSIDEVGHDFDGEETLSSLYWVQLPDVLLEISDLWCHRKRFSTSSCRTVWLHNIVYDPPTERSSSEISKLCVRNRNC
mgnify:CR=1 FL=1